MKRFLTVTLLLAVLVLTLAGCQYYSYDYKEEVFEYAMITESGDLSILDQYPNLEYVDLRGSTCYEEILDYAAAHPEVTVRYNVQLGEKRFDQDAVEIELNCYETEYDILLQNLKYLPDLTHVQLNQVTFTKEQFDALTGAYPDVTFTYTVELAGKRFEHTVTELDLSYLTSSDLEAAVNAFSLLPDLTSVNLVNSSGSSHLTVSDVKSLMDACPHITFHYEYKLFGQTVSTLSEKLIFDSVDIGNSGIDQIREALTILPNCTYVRLDSCGVSNGTMAQFRSEYPDITIAWRVFVDKFSILTDEEMLRMPYSLVDEDTSVLKYCNEIKYLDMVNCKITNIDFVSYMPKLECAIFTLTRISDLSPLKNCPNLTWLELASCSQIRDLSDLSGSTNLKYLNVSGTRVKDLSPLKGLPLERFKCVKSSVGKTALADFVANHPNCLASSKGSALGSGWRYDDVNQTVPCAYYAHMREVFRYDDKDFTGNQK